MPQRRLRAFSSAVVLLALAPAGCGGSGDAAPTPVALTKIMFKSPALAGTSLPARYTCDGQNVIPPLEWGAVPSTVKELALFILALKPAHLANGYSISIEWALAGVNPALHRLGAGRLPPGAHVGRASNGRTHYSICPKRGATAQYQFELYAVPYNVTIPANFAALQTLSRLATGSTPTTASARGGFTVSYKRS